MRIWPLLVLFATATTLAQLPAAPEPTGAVTGRVFCTDTNEPARFASVNLERIATPPTASKATGASEAPHATPKFVPVHPPSLVVATSLDGSFAFTSVAPGDYYVVVRKSGYISPRDMFTPKQMTDPSPQVRALINAALPRAHVEANAAAHVDVQIDRGAAISGTILYDDGSPAGDLMVEVLHKDASGKWLPLLPVAATDDRGYFRIPSLLADTYLVQATLSLTDTRTTVSSSSGHEMWTSMDSIRSSLPFYGAGTPRRKGASTIDLHSGQEYTGADMTIPVSKLHHITGRVAAGADGHFVNAADLALVYRDDGAVVTTAVVSRDDGLFHFDFVPSGDYILKVAHARDVVWEPVRLAPGASFGPFDPTEKEHVLKTYGDFEMPLLLDGDQLGITATIPPTAKSPATSP